MSEATALIYVGAGSFIHGVPARDLTAEEALKFGATITAQQQASGLTLYVPTTHKPAKPAKEGVDNG